MTITDLATGKSVAVSIRLLAGEVSGLAGLYGAARYLAGLNPLTGGRGVWAYPLQTQDPKALFGPLSNHDVPDTLKQPLQARFLRVFSLLYP
ncbi:hypothetical protein [Rhodobacter capsulatus]